MKQDTFINLPISAKQVSQGFKLDQVFKVNFLILEILFYLDFKFSLLYSKSKWPKEIFNKFRKLIFCSFWCLQHKFTAIGLVVVNLRFCHKYHKFSVRPYYVNPFWEIRKVFIYIKLFYNLALALILILILIRFIYLIKSYVTYWGFWKMIPTWTIALTKLSFTLVIRVETYFLRIIILNPFETLHHPLRLVKYVI